MAGVLVIGRDTVRAGSSPLATICIAPSVTSSVHARPKSRTGQQTSRDPIPCAPIMFTPIAMVMCIVKRIRVGNSVLTRAGVKIPLKRSRKIHSNKKSKTTSDRPARIDSSWIKAPGRDKPGINGPKNEAGVAVGAGNTAHRLRMTVYSDIMGRSRSASRDFDQIMMLLGPVMPVEVSMRKRFSAMISSLILR